jgi:plasmid stabilization system protein ParE
MAQLAFRSGALRDLAAIADYIETRSGSDAAERFAARIVSKCEALSRFAVRIGRRRPELGADYRSVPFGSYTIIFRYSDEDGPRSHMYVVAIVHGSRDIASYTFDET